MDTAPRFDPMLAFRKQSPASSPPGSTHSIPTESPTVDPISESLKTLKAGSPPALLPASATAPTGPTLSNFEALRLFSASLATSAASLAASETPQAPPQVSSPPQPSRSSPYFKAPLDSTDQELGATGAMKASSATDPTLNSSTGVSVAALKAALMSKAAAFANPNSTNGGRPAGGDPSQPLPRFANPLQTNTALNLGTRNEKHQLSMGPSNPATIQQPGVANNSLVPLMEASATKGNATALVSMPTQDGQQQYFLVMAQPVQLPNTSTNNPTANPMPISVQQPTPTPILTNNAPQTHQVQQQQERKRQLQQLQLALQMKHIQQQQQDQRSSEPDFGLSRLSLPQESHQRPAPTAYAPAQQPPPPAPLSNMSTAPQPPQLDPNTPHQMTPMGSLGAILESLKANQQLHLQQQQHQQQSLPPTQSLNVTNNFPLPHPAQPQAPTTTTTTTAPQHTSNMMPQQLPPSLNQYQLELAMKGSGKIIRTLASFDRTMMPDCLRTILPQCPKGIPPYVFDCVMCIVISQPAIHAAHGMGWEVLSHLWGITKADFDTASLHTLRSKTPKEQEAILILMASLNLTDIVNLSAFLISLIKQHERRIHVCMHFLLGMCDGDPDECICVHPVNTPGWDMLRDRWNVTYMDLDYAVLSNLARRDTKERDAILNMIAAMSLKSITNMSAFVSSAIRKYDTLVAANLL